ncbi:hypothetical protein HELRODRAFT_173888 [Helobdella robusta]|uniref:Radial spoke head protein 4 homolog A n=1 Tax=Helobdella robusta TaxID=6412 RepID=T1F7C2_HELRO|nr:hypothetical protein HELRODRAFT_173888 [Helobdella robusta]ESO03028.1 hypothetical protein HELRODRAFT_173888 [Helobdella robusta]
MEKTDEDYLKVLNSKLFLSAVDDETQLNVLDHVRDTLVDVLMGRPRRYLEACDTNKIRGSNKTFSDFNEFTKYIKFVQPIRNLFQYHLSSANENDGDSNLEIEYPNLLEQCYNFEQVGVGLNKIEYFHLWISIKKLMDNNHHLQSIRFWGKIFGTIKNYYILECEMKYDEEDETDTKEWFRITDYPSSTKRLMLKSVETISCEDIRKSAEFLMPKISVKDSLFDETCLLILMLKDSKESFHELPEDELAENDAGGVDRENDEVTVQLDVLPKIKFDKQVIPKEDSGSGTNKKTYFVTNTIGQDWIQLPHVTPAQITYARLIKKFFTGNVDHRVQSSPPFFEKEINYLRAQIARISASTDISPVGYFHFDEDEDDDMSNKQNIVMNTEYEALSVKELIDSSLVNWVHHSPYILTQGRTMWWNPVKNVDEDNEDNEENELPGVEPEIGLPLLTPLSEDVSINNVLPWITRKSTCFIQQHAVPSIHSNLWRGAHAYSAKKNYENIYFGWGLKNTGKNSDIFHPMILMEEYLDGPQNSEMDDPTPQNERLTNDNKKDLNENGKDKSEDNDDSNANQDDENEPIDE